MVCTIVHVLIAFVSSWTGLDATPGADLYSCGLACCDTVMYILQTVIETVSGMAYVHIGNHGTGFIDAARVSFTLFKRNYAKIAVIQQSYAGLSVDVFLRDSLRRRTRGLYHLYLLLVHLDRIDRQRRLLSSSLGPLSPRQCHSSRLDPLPHVRIFQGQRVRCLQHLVLGHEQKGRAEIHHIALHLHRLQVHHNYHHIVTTTLARKKWHSKSGNVFICRYHIGPTAFGSLIIMVCTIPHILIAFVSSLFGFDGTPGTELYNCGLDCCDIAMYMAVLKAVVEAVSGMAYVHIGNHGTGFIDAARVSFTLFRRHYAKITVLTQIEGIVCFFIEVTITALSVLLFWGLLHTQSVKLEERLGLLACFVVCIFSLVDSIVLLLVIATDTIFMCVLEDYEMNGGSSRPYHMSNKLKELVLENRLE
ncbi:unnamed protein product [Trichogramma brassicae]|uniref:Choline transporter-like protein n=1 Tax=Trichogramma brassicae TaxID=86971 RepID=A0A6H5I243_9HYME|nr:unnamed protein product [Trichogramma brassicae]